MTPAPTSPASQLVIYAPLEGRVKVVIDAANDGAAARLRDWLTHDADIHRLVSDAIELSRCAA